MKNIYILALGLAFYGTMTAQTAISLSNSNMPGSGDTLRYTNVQISSISNYTATGVNHTWNFSNLVSTTSGIREYKSALQTPYAFYFLSLNEYGEKIADTLVGGTGTISITKYYNFYKKQSSPNAFVADGVGMTISGIPVPSYYSDKDELYNFPLTYPKYDSTTFKFTTPSTTLIPVVYSKAGYRVTNVDGWGTITTPFGTDNCLRLVTTQYSRDTTKITIPAIPPLPQLPPIKIGLQNNQRSYQWFTTTSKIPFLEVTGNLIGNSFTLTQVRYKGYAKNGPVSIANEQDVSAMDLYPNPVKDALWLNYQGTEPLKASVLSSSGRLIFKADCENLEGAIKINTEELAQGLYILRIEKENAPMFIKFVKQ